MADRRSSPREPVRRSPLSHEGGPTPMTRSSQAVLEEVPTKRISAPTPMPNRAGRRASLTRQMSDTLNQFRETREGGGSSPTSPSLDERMEPDSPDGDLVSKVQGGRRGEEEAAASGSRHAECGVTCGDEQLGEPEEVSACLRAGSKGGSGVTQARLPKGLINMVCHQTV